MKRSALLKGGLVGAAICLGGFIFNHDQFFKSYLFAYLFWYGIAVGCLGILLLTDVVGGAWGDLIRPILEAATRTFPWLALLFVPLLWGLPVLYPWARPAAMADPLLAHKHLYLNVPFFCVRAALYFVLWFVLAIRPAPERRQQRSAPALVVYIFAVSFCAFDWMMSLEPLWSSTIYGVMVMIDDVLAALAFSACWVSAGERSRTLPSEDLVKPVHDLGNMILTFVMFWAYMAFSQYIVIWSGNEPDEISWYLTRQQGGWFRIAMLLIVFQFILPFLVLLGRRTKQKAGRLAAVAWLILAIHGVELYWLVEPPFHPEGLAIHWLDLAAWASVGALWMAALSPGAA